MAIEKYFYLDKTGLTQYDGLIKQYIDDRIAVFCDTTAGWNAQPQLIGKRGCIYIYSDYRQDEQHRNIAGIKIGDGQAYLIDAPFIDEILYDHINDDVRHITAEERAFWNAKVRCYINPDNSQNLMFTTN